MRISHKTYFSQFIFILTLLFLTASFTSNFVNDWKLAKNKNGITVHLRSVPNYQLKEYKCEMTSTASIDKLSSLLKDYSTHKDWGEGLAESTILDQKGEDEFHVYFLNPAPWPVSDRDIITRFQWEYWDDGTVNIKMEAAPDFIPHKDGRVRISYMKGYWRLTPLADGRVKVTTSAHANPGGNIPAWLANSGVVDIPYDTMLGLKTWAERGESTK